MPSRLMRPTWTIQGPNKTNRWRCTTQRLCTNGLTLLSIQVDGQASGAGVVVVPNVQKGWPEN